MCTKIRYSSITQARSAAKRYIVDGTLLAVGIYKCPACNFYHLTYSAPTKCRHVVTAREMGIAWMRPVMRVVDRVCGVG